MWGFNLSRMPLIAGAFAGLALMTGCGVTSGTGWKEDSISWDEALEYVGETRRVCGPFAGSGNSTNDVFINLGVDYPDPDRFTIGLWDVGSIDPIGNGSTICTDGEITIYEGGAQIQHYSVNKVEISD